MPVAFESPIDLTERDKTVESIKRVRARMLKQLGDAAFLILHRAVAIQHTDSDCICDPVIIGQNDWRESAYFADQILNPQVH